MQLYMSWYIRSFFGFTFLNILYFIFSRTLVLTSFIDVVFILSISKKTSKFTHYNFVWGIPWSLVNSTHNGQWCEKTIFMSWRHHGRRENGLVFTYDIMAHMILCIIIYHISKHHCKGIYMIEIYGRVVICHYNISTSNIQLDMTEKHTIFYVS